MTTAGVARKLNKKRPVGRPKLRPGESRERTATLRVRLSDAERALIEDAAGDQPPSTWARSVLIAASGGAGVTSGT